MKNQEERGYIYIMENSHYNKNNLFKVGYSIDPYNRAIELSRATGVLGKFHVVKKFQVSNMKKAENLIHNLIEEYRYSDNKEFFEIQSDILYEICDKIVECINIIEIKKEFKEKDVTLEEKTSEKDSKDLILGGRFCLYLKNGTNIIDNVGTRFSKKVFELVKNNKDFENLASKSKYFSKDKFSFKTKTKNRQYVISNTKFYGDTGLGGTPATIKITKEILELFGYRSDDYKLIVDGEKQ